MPAFIYENKLDPTTSNALQIQLQGSGSNTQALGAKIRVLTDDQEYYAEHYPIRGFNQAWILNCISALGKTNGHR